MYALFLESLAAKEVRHYAANHPEEDVEEMLKRTYLRGQQENAGDFYPKVEDITEADVKKYEDWWVSACLRGDAHVHYTVDSLMCWADTPEGHEYWSKVSQGGEDF